MQPETAQQRLPDPWPFSPVHGSGDRGDRSAAPVSATTSGATAAWGTQPTATDPWTTVSTPTSVSTPVVPPTPVPPTPALPAAPAGSSPASRPPAAAPPAAPAALGQAGTDADELVARLRARRSASGVAAVYAAAHGHPADPRAEHGARRWAVTGTTAVVAVVAVLLLSVGVAALSLRGGGVEPLAGVAADADPAGDEPGHGPPGGEPESPAAAGGPVPAAPETGAGPGSGPESGAAGTGLLVHVVGEVAEPGLVTVPDGARVADALQAAGGTTGKADLTAVNLARTVVDGEQLYVPRPGERVPGPTPGGGTPPDPGAGPATGGTVDINGADAVALEALPGVGPSIAQAIVEWRDTNGPFASVDELEDVPGIGPATLDEIRDSARVGP
ncbi:helix-hairpin-helix domain-containing protein [Promicromonospora vindobonensis]|uniref:Helix-hairpin-helix domain-containing protein n=1 Tax=Promicromonospora vindobonensis TaxID=195748 RepID=A0ABW5VM29_9MICO